MVIFGFCNAILQGLTMPALFLFLREIMGSFAGVVKPSNSKEQQGDSLKIMRDISMYMFYFALVQGAICFNNHFFFTWVAKKNVHHCRVNFFKRCLEQDAEFFDKNSPNEM